MSTDYKTAFKDLGAGSQLLQKHLPGAMEGFGKLHHNTMADGALTKKFKELIALSIGISSRCEGCIVSHARAAVRAGATPQEIAEAVGVSIMMGGGPATVYGIKALEAAETFAAA